MRPGFNVLSWSRQKTRGTYFLTTDRLPTMARPIGRQKPIKRTPVPCHPPPFMRKPQNSSVTPEKPCHLRKTQKEHPCLIFYKYALCTFIHQKVRQILAQSTSTTSHKPNKHLETLHHGIAFISCWQWQPDTWSGACRDIQGSSQQQGLGIECWAIVIVRQFVLPDCIALTA